MPYKIKSKCRDCGKETSHHKSIRCRHCSDKFRVGKNHPNWNGGKPKCVDCGKVLSTRKCLRCRQCAGRKRLREDNPTWIGGKYIKDGYVFVYKPEHPFCANNGYIREHRLVMEKYLGRLLNENEIIHHINGNTQDNRIGNLQLFNSHREHTIHHDLASKGFKTRFKKGNIPWNKKSEPVVAMK